jgi:hypothetical protein
LNEIKVLCNDDDIVFLQETWLISHELHSLSTLDDRFYAKGTSAVDTSIDVLRGRPHGGIAILWRKSLGGYRAIDMGDSRLFGIEVSSGKVPFYL